LPTYSPLLEEQPKLSHFWQHHFHNFNIHTQKKLVQKLEQHAQQSSCYREKRILTVMYRKILVKDEALERTLGAVNSPHLRRPYLCCIACLCLAFLCVFAVERDISRFICLAIAAAIAFGYVTHVKERAIIRHLGKAVGTVYVFQKRGGGRSVQRYIKYAFLSVEDRLFVGRSTIGRSAGIDGLGQTVPVLYNLEDPSVNLPLPSFWLYKFADWSGGRPPLFNLF
jgi:hypothetical protein